MVLPRLLTRLHVVIAVVLDHRDERLLLDPVEVFVQAIEQDVEELLRVLLL